MKSILSIFARAFLTLTALANPIAICVLVGLVTIQPANSSSILYGGAGNFGTALDGSILTVNQSTGAGTLVGTPSTVGITGLAFDSFGNLYGSTIKGGVTLEKINPDSGLQISSIALSRTAGAASRGSPGIGDSSKYRKVNST